MDDFSDNMAFDLFGNPVGEPEPASNEPDTVQDGPDLFGNDPAEMDPAPVAREDPHADENVCASAQPVAVVDDEGDVVAVAIDEMVDDSASNEGSEPDPEPVAPADPEPKAEPEVEVSAENAPTPISTSSTKSTKSTKSKSVAKKSVKPDESEPQPEAQSEPTESLALYRRYRPDVFSDVIGQEHVTEPLMRALDNNKVAHAYLFSGPRGCGKTTSARILARCLNCAKGPTSTPCGECDSCRDLATGGPGSIDVIEIDAASHGGVDDARDLREKAFFAPVNARYKIYIVDEAHMVSSQGFNALLKLVEEPPPHVKFIFATTEPEKVIGTIRSRTHHYPFRLVPPKVMGSFLADICAREGVDIDPAVLPLVMRAGGGSVRDSLSILDQLLGGANGQVSYEHAMSLLGYTSDVLLDEVVDAFIAHDGSALFATVDKIMDAGADPRGFVQDLLNHCRDLMILAVMPDAIDKGVVNTPEFRSEKLVDQASRFGSNELTRATEIIADTLMTMRGTTAPRLMLELMCAKVLLPPNGSVADLAQRVAKMERALSNGTVAVMPSGLPERQGMAAQGSAPSAPTGGVAQPNGSAAGVAPSMPANSSGSGAPATTRPMAQRPSRPSSLPQRPGQSRPVRPRSSENVRAPQQPDQPSQAMPPQMSGRAGRSGGGEASGAAPSDPDASVGAGDRDLATSGDTVRGAGDHDAHTTTITVDEMKRNWRNISRLVNESSAVARSLFRHISPSRITGNTLVIGVNERHQIPMVRSRTLPTLIEVLRAHFGITFEIELEYDPNAGTERPSDDGHYPPPPEPPYDGEPGYPADPGYGFADSAASVDPGHAGQTRQTGHAGGEAPFRPGVGSSDWVNKAKSAVRATTTKPVTESESNGEMDVDFDNDEIVEVSLDNSVAMIVESFNGTVIEEGNRV